MGCCCKKETTFFEDYAFEFEGLGCPQKLVGFNHPGKKKKKDQAQKNW